VKFLLPGKVETVVFHLLTPPSIDAVRTALKSLEDLNVIDKAKTLTPLGLHLARMPVDAQVGKLLIFACMLKYLDPILTIAASLSARSPLSHRWKDARKLLGLG
jgi:HrpA-like RNA helicase